MFHPPTSQMHLESQVWTQESELHNSLCSWLLGKAVFGLQFPIPFFNLDSVPPHKEPFPTNIPVDILTSMPKICLHPLQTRTPWPSRAERWTHISNGTLSWGWTWGKACPSLRRRFGVVWQKFWGPGYLEVWTAVGGCRDSWQGGTSGRELEQGPLQRAT